MTTRSIVQAALEIWGSVLCVILLITSMLDKEYVAGKKKTLLWLYAATALTLLLDSLAWIFRGWPGTLGLVMVYVSNTAVFIMNYIILLLYTLYLQAQLPIQGRRMMQPFIHAMMTSLILLSLLLIGNFWTQWFFSVDAQNYYHRGPFHWVLLVVGLLGTLCDGHFLLTNRKSLQEDFFTALLVYIILPSLAQALLLFYYGLSLLHMAICISIVCLFIQSFKAHYRRMMERERELSAMKTHMLVSQIEPHFLYNCLTTIKYLCRTSPDQAADAVDEFSQFIRGNLDGLFATAPIPFSSELEHVQNYLALEKRRFGQRLQVKWDIQDQDFQIPSLTLQPIVENAVRHGVTKRPEGGQVCISARRLRDAYQITVADNGVGFEPGQLDTSDEDAGHHLGLQNVRSRLEYICHGVLQVQSCKGKGTTVTMILPIEQTP